MASVGLRALQQNASAVVARAQAGEVIEITDRGRPVAQIVPIRRGSRIQELLASGHLRPASRTLRETSPPIAVPVGSQTLGEILAEMRADER